MSMFIVIFTFIIISEVKCDLLRQTKWWSMDGTTIESPITEYCRNKNCVIKCCPDGQNLIRMRNVTAFVCMKMSINNTVFNNYIEWDNSSSQVNNMKETSYFYFIQNDIYSHLINDSNSHPLWMTNEGILIRYYNKDPNHGKVILLQDGTISTPDGTIDRLEFCLDFFATRKGSFLAFGVSTDPKDPYEKAKHLYIAAGMLISSFFMILVLFVYAVLPNLQNIVGMVLIAYLLSLTIAYILRGSHLIAATYYEVSIASCRTITPAIYFFFLASFFWLNIMAFDLWWTLRGSRKCRDIHRRGERVKFLIYSVYAWGIPALMTSILVILDIKNAIVDPRFKPPFESCLVDLMSTRLYLYLPIGIMTAVNCVLFTLTVYNIWLIRKSIVTSRDSSNTKNSENRSKIYGKLFVLMGVTWILEQIPSVSLPWHIVLNSLNLFVGVIIFYIFVCKKSTIVMLCNRFNIRNSYLDRFQSTNYSKTENTSVHLKSSSSRKFREGTELSTYSTRE